MTLDRAANFLGICGAMILVASALIVRRRGPHRPTLVMLLIWAAIFAILFIVAHQIDVARQGR